MATLIELAGRVTSRGLAEHPPETSTSRRGTGHDIPRRGRIDRRQPWTCTERFQEQLFDAAAIVRGLAALVAPPAPRMPLPATRPEPSRTWAVRATQSTCLTSDPSPAVPADEQPVKL